MGTSKVGHRGEIMVWSKPVGPLLKKKCNQSEQGSHGLEPKSTHSNYSSSNKDTKTALELKINTKAQEVNILRDDHTKLVDRVSNAEFTLAQIRPTVTETTTCIKALEKELTKLAERAENAEGRSLCNNVKIVRLCDKVPSAELFLEEWLSLVVLEDKVSRWFTVERAYRVLVRPPILGATPHAMMAGLLNVQDRDTTLQAAHSQGP
ncbi:hypothetical protein NDU88_003671 [Pleurodeles waltl]|uniref:Uncharacterized protein n=1 Tax=Pleurodeles waltl TaxID=8319 RepID=A0AAV7VIG9_PLEWA|nr:hypothetical protein NDU88_003671 [Pleurodeles waltl]